MHQIYLTHYITSSRPYEKKNQDGRFAKVKTSTCIRIKQKESYCWKMFSFPDTNLIKTNRFVCYLFSIDYNQSEFWILSMCRALSKSN